MPALNSKPYLEIKESRLMSFVIATVALIVALCAPFALGPLVGIIVAVGGLYYSYVHWRRFFSADRVTIRIDEEGLSGSMVSRGGVVPWSAVENCTKAFGSEDYTIRLKSGKTVKISQLEMPVFSNGLKDYVDSHLAQADAESKGS